LGVTIACDKDEAETAPRGAACLIFLLWNEFYLRFLYILARKSGEIQLKTSCECDRMGLVLLEVNLEKRNLLKRSKYDDIFDAAWC
jgi:hypothetical protein